MAPTTALSRHETIDYSDKFDDPNMPGEMKCTVTLKAVACGTEINILQEGVPDQTPVEGCYLGWQESLEKLKKRRAENQRGVMRWAMRPSDSRRSLSAAA